MGTITYTHEPASTVWIITSSSCPAAVKSGTVIQVRGNALITETKVAYDIRIAGDTGTTEFLETDVFGTLGDAIAEYQTRLTV